MCADGSVRFARYCGKMDSRHLFDDCHLTDNHICFNNRLIENIVYKTIYSPAQNPCLTMKKPEVFKAQRAFV